MDSDPYIKITTLFPDKSSEIYFGLVNAEKSTLNLPLRRKPDALIHSITFKMTWCLRTHPVINTDDRGVLKLPILQGVHGSLTRNFELCLETPYRSSKGSTTEIYKDLDRVEIDKDREIRNTAIRLYTEYLKTFGNT